MNRHCLITKGRRLVSPGGGPGVSETHVAAPTEAPATGQHAVTIYNESGFDIGHGFCGGEEVEFTHVTEYPDIREVTPTIGTGTDRTITSIETHEDADITAVRVLVYLDDGSCTEFQQFATRIAPFTWEITVS